MVDDDPSMHDLVQAMLKGTEWEVDSAQDGEEALERVKAGAYDLVLTDILMPGMDGLTLLSRLRERHPDTRVVVMTIKNTADHILGSLRREAAGYVSKPFTREALIMSLREALCEPAGQGRYSGSFGPASMDFAANPMQGRNGRPFDTVCAGIAKRPEPGRPRAGRHGVSGVAHERDRTRGAPGPAKNSGPELYPDRPYHRLLHPRSRRGLFTRQIGPRGSGKHSRPAIPPCRIATANGHPAGRIRNADG